MFYKTFRIKKCEDEEFKQFQQKLQYCVFDFDSNKFKVKNDNNDDEISDSSNNSRVGNKDNQSNSSNKTPEISEQKISTKKRFLLMATVIFLAAVIFFTINLIFAFLAISQTLTIILAAIAAISLVASLVISIKNDVINRPTCLGREKSFIDLSQNKEAKKEVPDQIKSMKKMSTSILDDK